MRKPAKESFVGSDDLKKARKLKPLKKEKNVKRSLFKEIDELEDIDLNYRSDEDEVFFEENDDDY
jgi:hypothetical protein